ncbi:MAG: thiamine phosphate synthase [Solirubrobacteraceae bacterium]
MDDHRRRRLAEARLYLVSDARPASFLNAALAGGVDIVQLRDKRLDDEALVVAARHFREACDAHDALFVLNDRPDLVAACEADGVHVGQNDVPVPEARALVGEDRLVGLSTHSSAQIDAAGGVDYVALGPVHETPTKPGRPATGLDPIRHAAAHARVPWFAIGGLDVPTITEAIGAGARRAVVVRAIGEAEDPEAAARALRTALDAHPLEAEARVGAT